MSDSSVWQPGGFVEDRWQVVSAEDELPDGGSIIVPLSRWRELKTRNTLEAWEIGLAMAAGEEVDEIVADLGRIALVALDFPKFTDGRAYSAARLLRERYGYAGELRATGDVLLDQIAFMLRCGFDTFVISHEPTRRALNEGRLPEVPIFLQPAGERGEVQFGARPWLRRRV